MTTHPVTVLRWLRNGVLLSLAAAALLYLWVAIQARHEIAAIHRTQQAIAYIEDASDEAATAQSALQATFNKHEDVTLTGTGKDYVNDITQVNKYLTLATEDNAAGTAGTSQIQYVSGELESYLGLSEYVVIDYSLGGRPFGLDATTYANGGENTLTSALGQPQTCQELARQEQVGSAPTGLAPTEDNALCAQLSAWPLDPGTFWWILLGPAIVMLLLVTATAYVLARHFRRRLSRWLWGSLLAAAATSITVGAFNVVDERDLSGSQLAGNPATITLALLLFLAAGAQAYLAYHPRLAEYRFRSS
jgi:type II secretory pathway pseudopilin PulG